MFPVRRMDADWEVEIGGGAAVIEAEWPGFIDLRNEPDRVRELEEVAGFAPLGNLLRALNAPPSPLWTAKCDVWEAELGGLCCYVDLLPVAGRVFAKRVDAEKFCRAVVFRLTTWLEMDCGLNNAAELVIRTAVAGQDEGFGVTAYLSGDESVSASAQMALELAMDIFADAVLLDEPRATGGSKLQ
jgi:hypothetical protein